MRETSRSPVSWHFAQGDEDGSYWLENPSILVGYIDYISPRDAKKRRVAVVTESWVRGQLAPLAPGGGGAWIGLPTALVLPDIAGQELRAAIGALVASDGIDEYGVAM